MTCGHVLYLWRGGAWSIVLRDKWPPAYGELWPSVRILVSRSVAKKRLPSMQGYRAFRPVHHQKPGCLSWVLHPPSILGPSQNLYLESSLEILTEAGTGCSSGISCFPYQTSRFRDSWVSHSLIAALSAGFPPTYTGQYSKHTAAGGARLSQL